MRSTSIAHEFVESIPCELESGVLYISIDFRTTMHLCACGCGNEVVLPLRPAAWSLTYDGVDVSMSPSVGNWSFECLSHYWIRRSQVEWAGDWSDQQIASGRQRTLVERGAIPALPAPEPDRPKWWRRIMVSAATRLGPRSRARMR